MGAELSYQIASGPRLSHCCRWRRLRPPTVRRGAPLRDTTRRCCWVGCWVSVRPPAVDAGPRFLWARP